MLQLWLSRMDCHTSPCHAIPHRVALLWVEQANLKPASASDVELGLARFHSRKCIQSLFVASELGDEIQATSCINAILLGQQWHYQASCNMHCTQLVQPGHDGCASELW